MWRGVQPFRTSVPPFATRDLWTVLPDGRIVVASALPYRVQVFHSSRTSIASSPVAFKPVSVDEAHKEGWRAEKRRPTAITVFDASGVRGQETVLPIEEPETWPRTLPPFLDQPLRVGADGTIWIERTVRSNAPGTIDIFDDAGKHVAQLELPKGRRLAGIGRTTIYLIRSNEDDLQSLEGWRRPPLRR